MGGCNDPVAPPTTKLTLRVGAPYGLSKFSPVGPPSGSTAYALGLAFDQIRDHVRVGDRSGLTVTLHRLATSPYSTAILAGSIRIAGLQGAEPTSKTTLKVRFVDRDSADSFVARAFGGFALGPFTLHRQVEGAVWLRARTKHPIDSLQIVQVDQAQQWRQLTGRALHVVPNTASLYRKRFAGLDTVRLLDLPVTREITLLFNVRDPVLSRPMRRKLAELLDLRAIASVACGDADCASEWLVSASPAPTPTPVTATSRALQLPPKLSIIVLASDESMNRAAQVIRHQLRPFGVEITIEKLELPQVLKRGSTGDFQLLLSPMPPPSNATFLKRFSSAPKQIAYNWSGYNVPSYDAALATARGAAARAMLRRDLPVIPLFQMREFAAVDTAFCGGRPQSPTSWKWLAELYPCDSKDQP